MLNLPLVSFVVTSYNYENYIIKTLESIKSQTYANFEIIIVDDKSSDNSIEIINKFIEDNQDLRITLVEHEYNWGQLKAFQTGLNKAQGQFVSFIDSDDVITKDYAKTHINVHLNTSVAFTSSQIFEIDENDSIHSMHSVSGPQIKETVKKVQNDNLNIEQLIKVDVENVDFKVLNTKSAPFGGWYWSPSSSAMFRKSSIEIILDYDKPQNWRICPDKFLFNLAHLIGGSAIIYAPLAGYRRQGGDQSPAPGSRMYHRRTNQTSTF